MVSALKDRQDGETTFISLVYSNMTNVQRKFDRNRWPIVNSVKISNVSKRSKISKIGTIGEISKISNICDLSDLSKLSKLLWTVGVVRTKTTTNTWQILN